MNVKIIKKIHYNTGNFSNCEASIEISDEILTKDDYKRISALSDAMLALESVNVLQEIISANKVGNDNYMKSINDNLPKIGKVLNLISKENS